MNYLHLFLLCEIAILRVRAGHFDLPQEPSMHNPLRRPKHLCNDSPSNKPTLPLENVNMEIIDHCRVIARVNLKQTKRVLANEHLPVWISKEYVDTSSLYNNQNDGLERNYEVMEQLGEFTMYHDIETSSAAIYFHKQRQFDGMIGYKYLIQKLPVDKIDPTNKISVKLDLYGVYNRPGYIGHQNDCEEWEEDPMAGINYQQYRKTYNSRVYDAYPEVLVIVSSRVFKDWIRKFNKSEWYTSIVSNVLTLFNGVDMLYSKLKKTKIQINIAGIIIEEEASFLFLEKCYFSDNTADHHYDYKLDGECANFYIRTYLYGRRGKFPKDSFDLVVYLAGEKIYLKSDRNESDETAEPIIGVSGMMLDLYKSHSEDSEAILVGIITYIDYLENYSTIAHEIAHLMTVMHDKLPFVTHDGKCIGGILKTSGGWCDNCLNWSDTSEESLKLFFSSPNCCAMINEPRSLHPPGRQLMLTSDDQCQCYGYQSTKAITKIPEDFCHSQLLCGGESNRIERTIIPMDGTPCGTHKVCWKRSCQYITIFKSTPLLEK